jgi:hypothetical protein
MKNMHKVMMLAVLGFVAQVNAHEVADTEAQVEQVAIQEPVIQEEAPVLPVETEDAEDARLEELLNSVSQDQAAE